MKRLTRQEITEITNEACELLYNADKDDILAFEETENSVKPVLLKGGQTNGKTDLFPRNEDPNMHVYMHLASLYGDDDSF